MPEITLKPGLRLHYLDINPDGQPTVLLLHGLGVSGSSWQLQFPALSSAGYRILAPDARGHGKSSYMREPLSIETMAGDMVALLRRTARSPVHAVGISMGGTLALQIALDHPVLVEKLVLVNTFARLRPTRLTDGLYLAVRSMLVHTLGLPAQARYVARRLFPDPKQEGLRNLFIEEILQASPAGYRAAMRALARFNVEHRLSEIDHPVLVITGERDTTVPKSLQRRLAGAIPGARQVILPDAGHAAIVEYPEEFNSLIVHFLQSHPIQARPVTKFVKYGTKRT